MRIEPTSIDGVFTVELERRGDDRGFFARTFCAEEFRAAGLDLAVFQGNLSVSREKGTMRGLHYQTDPAAESKLVRCTRGAIFDVVVDFREGSPTYLEHLAVRLDSENRTALYVPRHVAHGFLTLEPDTEVNYLVSAPYTPEAERGVRYDDPRLAIDWPIPVTVITPKDTAWPLLD